MFLFISFYVLAVYAMNSFADYDKDKNSERLKLVGNISKSTYTTLFVLFCVLFGFFAYTINITVLILSFAALLLWSTYYLSPLRLKSTFLGGTLIHFLGGILHFHTGYCSYEAYNFNSLAISIYFALLLSAGHFHHEIMDHDDDKASGSKTTAVRIGTSRVLLLRTFLIGFTLLYWVSIYFMNITGIGELIIFSIPTATLFAMSILMQDKNIKAFQKVSRSIFLMAGIALVLIKLAEKAGYF